jgi:pyrophosphatase PpaX
MAKARRLAILFDLDGTLVDSIELIVSSARYAFSCREGPAPTTEQFVAGIGQPLVAQLSPYCTNDEEIQFLIAKYREYQLANHDRLTTAYDGIPQAVHTLHAAGHALAVVTSKIEWLAHRALGHVGLAATIGLVIGCDATTRHKPHPEPVLLALERLEMAAADAIFVGDSPYDILAGREAGVTAVAALWGAFPRPALESAGAHFTLERPSELPAFVERFRTNGHPAP